MKPPATAIFPSQNAPATSVRATGMTGPGVVDLEAGADAFAASRPFPPSLHAANAMTATAIVSVDTRRAGIRATVPAIVSQRSAIVHAGANAWPTSGNLDPAGLSPMAAQAVPRYLLGQALALMGLGGGNDRALANAEGILDGLLRAREQVDALEVRIAHVAPARQRVGWPVSPPDGPVPAPPAVRARRVERGAGRGRTSVQPIMSRLL